MQMWETECKMFYTRIRYLEVDEVEEYEGMWFVKDHGKEDVSKELGTGR